MFTALLSQDNLCTIEASIDVTLLSRHYERFAVRAVSVAYWPHGEQANRATVLSALASHAMVHFACHGVSNANNPSASRLILHDHEFSPLTVQDVARQSPPHAELAYLSACDTAGFSFTLADEAIRLTTAFQLAGYNHVIGILWPIDDWLAAEIAELFYGELRAAGFNPDRSAFALHAATRSIRDRYVQFPRVCKAIGVTGL